MTADRQHLLRRIKLSRDGQVLFRAPSFVSIDRLRLHKLSVCTEAMQLMVEGDKWEMYIPSEMAYGSRGSPPKIGSLRKSLKCFSWIVLPLTTFNSRTGPDEVLIFRMEIIKINGATKPALRCNVVTLEECDSKEKDFIEKQKAKASSDKSHYATELARLKTMKDGKMKPELHDWLVQRIGLLTSLKDDSKSEL